MRARALSTLGGVHRIGWFLGPFLGALVVARWEVSAAYVVGGIASLGAFVLVLVAPDITSRERAAAGAGAAAVGGLGSGGSSAGPHDARRRSHVGLGGSCVREALVPLWAESVGLLAGQTSLVFGVAGAVDMALFYPSGWLMDRHGRVAAAVPSMLILGLGMALLPLSLDARGRDGRGDRSRRSGTAWAPVSS